MVPRNTNATTTATTTIATTTISTTMTTTATAAATTTTSAMPDAHRDRGDRGRRAAECASVALARFSYLLLRACDWTIR